MALLKIKEISSMDVKSRKDKIKELELELMKSQTGAQKSLGKTKEIKRTIARLKTLNVSKGTMKENNK
jgi:ribosomal protein L29